MTKESMLAILKQLPKEFRQALALEIQESIDSEYFASLNEALDIGEEISTDNLASEYRCCT